MICRRQGLCRCWTPRRRDVKSIVRSASSIRGASSDIRETGWWRRLPQTQQRRTILIIRAITDAVWQGICAFDAGVFGADRSALLARLRGRAPQLEWFVERDGKIVGVLAGPRWPRRNSDWSVGRRRRESGARASGARRRCVDGSCVYRRAGREDRHRRALLAAHGFESQRPLTRMVLGRSVAFDDGTRNFCRCGTRVRLEQSSSQSGRRPEAAIRTASAD